MLSGFFIESSDELISLYLIVFYAAMQSRRWGRGKSKESKNPFDFPKLFSHNVARG